MKKLLLSFAIIAVTLFSGCSKEKEPTDFLGVDFGTEYDDVKSKMINNGYQVYSAPASRESIVFYGGDFMGVDADLITMDMANDYTFNTGVAMFTGDVEKVIKSLEDIISKKYGKTPEVFPSGSATRYRWSFPSAYIRIGGNERSVILTISNN